MQKLLDISVLKEFTEPKVLVDVFFEMEYIYIDIWNHICSRFLPK